MTEPDTTVEPEGFDYISGFLDRDRADALFDALWRHSDWSRESITLFGRRVPQPRLTAWHADPGADYAYSGLTLKPRPWTAELDWLRGELAERVGTRFNAVLLNGYRDGRDSMGWHSDDEPELGPEPVIASVNLGATRRMRIRRTAGGPSTAIDLAHGSLLLMSGRSQRDWRHSVPKTRRAVGPRINLTFRRVLGAQPPQLPA